MNIEIIKLKDFSTNCYLVELENYSYLIDPGTTLKQEIDLIKNKIKKPLKAILLTHCHYDHIAGCNYFNVPSYLHKNDFELLKKQVIWAKQRRNKSIELPKNILSLENTDINYKNTPGHTPGGVYFQFENNLFTGDTLFVGTYGITNAGGNELDMINSLKLFLDLDDNFKIYPGHGYIGKLKEQKNWIKELVFGK